MASGISEDTRDSLEYRLRELLNEMDRDRISEFLASDAVSLSRNWRHLEGFGAPDVLKHDDVLFHMVFESFSESLLHKNAVALKKLITEASRPRRLPALSTPRREKGGSDTGAMCV